MTPHIIDQFIQSLLESGLPQDRIEFYLNRLKGGEFNEEDRQSFITEIEEHIAKLDAVIDGAEKIIDYRKQEYTQQEEEILPMLQKITEVQPEVQQQELEDYQRELADVNEKFMQKKEILRHSHEQNQIDALHSFLKKGR